MWAYSAIAGKVTGLMRNDAIKPNSGVPASGWVPGVIYEWTPEGMAQVVDPDDDKVLSASFRAGDEPIPGYYLSRRIGSGATSEVWEAIAPAGIAVALKFIEGGRREVADEMLALSKVRHGNLVSIFEVWQREEWVAIGMELAEGSLMDRFEEARSSGAEGLERVEAIDLLRQAAVGIDFLNEPRLAAPAGLAHRDIKPQNLLIVAGRVKVGDFGLIARVPEKSTSNLPTNDDVDNDALESLIAAYCSPEVRRGAASARSDQYSLAATYCYLRQGRPPAGIDAVELMMLPVAERPAVARALATDPADRWPTCAAFVAALAADDLGAGATLTSTPSPAVTVDLARFSVGTWPRLGLRTPALAVGCLAMLGLTWLLVFSGPGPTSPSVAIPTPGLTLAPPAAVDNVPEFVAPTAEPNHVAAQAPTQAPLETAREPTTVTEVESDPTLDLTEPARSTEPAPTLEVARDAAVVVAAAEPPSLATPVEVPSPVAVAPGPTSAEVREALAAWSTAVRSRAATRLDSAWSLAQRGLALLPKPPARPAPAARRAEPPLPRTSTIIVRLPSSKAELVVRGAVGRGNPDEWYGPRRVIHSPPLDAPQDYLIGAFWTDPIGRQMTRSTPVKVVPGRLYEVDLRGEAPTAAEVTRPLAP